MENQKVLLAIMLSLAILLGYQYFFVPAAPVPEDITVAGKTAGDQAPARDDQSPGMAPAQITAGNFLPSPEPAADAGKARDIVVETGLYRAVFTENGGMLKSFQLKKYRESLAEDSDPMELVATSPAEGLPLNFSWGVEPGRAGILLYEADRERIDLGPSGQTELIMRATLSPGLEIVRTLTFTDQDYRIKLDVSVTNNSATPLQGAPYLTMVNRPFSGKANGYVFTGPALLIDGALEEVKVDDLEKGSSNFTGRVNWVAYEDTYFMCGIIPEGDQQLTANFSLSGEDRVTSTIAGAADLIQVGGQQHYGYTAFFGPKELDTLKAVGGGLDRIVNFGWFDVVAKPTLFLLNFFYGFVGNYGVAIILVTVLIKLLFWPIAQKGMKSMKTMQKLQPKMQKLREKYKDDKERQQQEMMKLYQTYKVNPLGGCLPMVLQIPVFFALYKVLLQTIELRHAPFMLWINDLAAPDRLFIGFDIPWLGGIPVLTLLMGGSMFLQQKMTPTTGDPTQAKVMMFLPVIFTFMFLNFASGLVLYWFVNNLLAIGQQYMINRQVAD